MSEPLKGMNAEQFVVWLNGYLSARPDLANDEIREVMSDVIAAIVKQRLLRDELAPWKLRDLSPPPIHTPSPTYPYTTVTSGNAVPLSGGASMYMGDASTLEAAAKAISKVGT